MQYTLLLTILCFFLSTSANFAQNNDVKNYCNYKESRDSAKLALRPYRYTAQKRQNVTLANHKQFNETVVPVFQDTKYKFVVNANGLPGQLTVKVYTESKENNNRDKIFEKSTEGGQFTYETKKSKEYEHLYFDFIYPAKQSKNLDLTERGCVILLSGYQVKFTEDSEDSGDGFLSNLFSGDDEGGEENE